MKKNLPQLSGAIRSYLFSVFSPPGAIRSYPELSGAIFFLVFSFPELSGAIRSYEFLIFFTPGAIRSYLLCFFLVFSSSGAIRSYPELPGAIKNWFLGKKNKKVEFCVFFLFFFRAGAIRSYPELFSASWSYPELSGAIRSYPKKQVFFVCF